MAFEYAVGSFAFPTVTGNFSVTGLTFQPKLVRFWGNARTADGSATHNQSFFGAAVSSSSRFAIATDDEDGVTTSNNARRHSNAACILIIAGGNGLTTWSVADFVAFTSDGFTVNVTTEVNVAHIVNYEAYGGADLTNVAIKEFTTPGSVTSVGYTGVGFEPDAMMLYSAFHTTAPVSTANSLRGSIGLASSPSAQAVVSFTAVDAQGAADTAHAQATDSVLLNADVSGTPPDQAALTSFDADGFTLNYSASAGASYCWAICLKGGAFKVGEITQKTSTGNQAYTGAGFLPKGISLLSANDDSNSDSEAHLRLSYGAGTSSSSRGSIWFGDVDAADPTQVDSNLDRTKVMKMMTAGTPTTEAAADIVSLDSDGFTLDWTTADATARTIIYMAFGDTLPSAEIAAVAATASATAEVPTVTAVSNDALVSAEAATASATAEVPTIVVLRSPTIASEAATATAAAQLPTITAVSNSATISAVTATATATANTLSYVSARTPTPTNPLPAGGEIDVVNSLVKDMRTRITVGVDYKAWTADRTVDFSGELSKEDVQWSPGAKPEVSGGSAFIKSYGTPCFEWFRTRDDFFPEDPTVPFRARVRATFPQGDPVYTNGFVIGHNGIDGDFGAASDCRVLQVGAVDCEGFAGNEGKILAMPPSQILTPSAPGYSGTIEVEVEWDPGNTPQYRMLVNGGEVFTSQDAPRPVLIGIGYPTFVEAIKPDPDDPAQDTNPPEVYEALGLADAPVDIIEVLEVTVEELGGGGHETVVFPSWTTPNAGGDIDTALEGERFVLEGRTCAKLFMSNVISARITRSASSEFDTFSVTLGLPKVENPDTYINLYAGTRWDCEPPILIDTRESDDEGNWTDWRRHIAGRIWKAHIEYGDNGVPHLALSGPCIALAQLYSEASMAFIKAEETLPGIFQNLTFTEVFEAMLEEARNLDGDQWEPTDHILAPDIIPDQIGTGGQTLLSTANDWWDRLGQKRYVRYSTSGDAQFGQVISHLQTIGTGTGQYGFRGLGGDPQYFPVMSASRDDDRRAAPGQIQYHPNVSLFAWLDIGTYGAAGTIVGPAWPYPANAATWSDSLAYTASGMGTLITSWPDKNAVGNYGGPAKFRLRGETVRAQRFTFEVIGHDYIEPDHEVFLDDPNGVGYVGTIIVDRVEVEYAGLKITTRVSGFGTDPAAIMGRRK